MARINDIECQLISAAGILVPFLAPDPQPYQDLSHMTKPQLERHHTRVSSSSIRMQIYRAISELGCTPGGVIYNYPLQEREVIDDANKHF